MSDLYQIQEEEPMLELKVIMLNINDGNNEELKECCQTLKEYMQFVNRIRKYIYQENMQIDEAVERAVTECIGEGILEQFLIESRAEVVAMSIFEFDEEKEWKKYGEAEYQYGVEVGIRLGRSEGLERGSQKRLIQMISKKLRKGMSVERIAMELEEDIEVVRNICDVAKDYAPEYREEEIVKALQL